MRTGAAGRLQALAWLLLASLPLAMAIANRSAPALLAGAALAALAGRGAGGELRQVRAALRAALRPGLALACLAFLAVAITSLGWSRHGPLTLRGLVELGIAAGAALLLHGSLPRAVPRWALIAAASLAGAGCLWILVELATDSALRAALGFRSESFIFKRSATAILIVFWPLAYCLWRAGQRAAVLAIGALLLASILWSHAAAALLGLLAGVMVVGGAALFRKATQAALGLALLLALALAPVTGDLAGRFLPPSVLDALHESQARDRILIWQSFGEVVRARPVLGTGFGTSPALGRDPVLAEIRPDRRLMLAVGHPHNGYLQIWTELGTVGALVAGLVLALLLRTSAAADRRAAVPGLAAIACAAAIMLVAHGAWQGWWIATIGAAAIWTIRLAGFRAVQASAGASDGASVPPRNPVART
ncbi:MAG: O-antigen polymerase [Enterovirga sp.]|nr:O-antigen polymerase [Enterovirga sp.]